jgi:hypothetical protein
MQNGWADIFTVDMATETVTNLTKDEIANYAPAYSLDGKSVVYLARISGNEKLFKLDLDGGKKTQLTFGTHDDAAARFLDADTLIFASTATDPNKPVEPEVARNGQVFNIWTLGLKTGELKQFTDTVGGNSRRSSGAMNRRRRSPSSPITRATTNCTRWRRRTRSHGRDGGLRRARPRHRLPGPAQPHAHFRQQGEEGLVGQDVPRRPPAAERGRDQRRQLLRQHRGLLHRRARRSPR